LLRGIERRIVVCPAGCGRTIIFSALFARRGGSATVLAERDELPRQAAAKLAWRTRRGRSASGSSPRSATSALRSSSPAGLTLAQARRLGRLPQPFDTVVVDACHHASARSYGRIPITFSGSPLIRDVTVTPARSDARGLVDAWQEAGGGSPARDRGDAPPRRDRTGTVAAAPRCERPDRSGARRSPPRP
jgi:superfamily II DNA or RNA helicase